MALINLTPTWGEIGNLAVRLAVTHEDAAFEHLRPELAKAFAAAQALQNITKTLTDEQSRVVSETMVAELTKQGF